MVGKAARDRLDVILAWGHVRAAAGFCLAGQLPFRDPVGDDRLDRAVGQQGEGFEALVHVHTHTLLRVQHVPDARMIDLEGHARDHVARGGRDVGRAALPAAGPVVEGQPMVEQEDGRDGAQVVRIRTAVTVRCKIRAGHGTKMMKFRWSAIQCLRHGFQNFLGEFPEPVSPPTRLSSRSCGKQWDELQDALSTNLKRHHRHVRIMPMEFRVKSAETNASSAWKAPVHFQDSRTALRLRLRRKRFRTRTSLRPFTKLRLIQAFQPLGMILKHRPWAQRAIFAQSADSQHRKAEIQSFASITLTRRIDLEGHFSTFEHFPQSFQLAFGG